jgi:hypothetical protein
VVAVAGWLVLHGRTDTPVETPQEAVAPLPVVNENIYGYRIEGPDVIFEFDAREYDTARMADGSLGDVSTVANVSSVCIAGPFNEWTYNRPEWQLVQVARNRFELRVPLKKFTGRAEWPFKFVVNEKIWVGAPAKAENKMVVAEDTATYNLILAPPNQKEDQQTAMLRRYREQINRTWPGQGWNLTVNSNQQYQFVLTASDENSRIRSLEALRGVPLHRLDVSLAYIRDFSTLQGTETLQFMVCSEASYLAMVSGVLAALEQGDFTLAKEQADAVFAQYGKVPACAHFRTLVQHAVRNQQALSNHPDVVPEQAYEFDGHRYAFIMLPMSWTQANNMARRYGGYLVAVNSAEEQDWITRTFGLGSLGRNLWLGATDSYSEGIWTWGNGETWTYENWTPPEPNNQDNNEHVLAMKPDGWWMDVNGDAVKYPFLIEWN